MHMILVNTPTNNQIQQCIDKQSIYIFKYKKNKYKKINIERPQIKTFIQPLKRKQIN